MTGSDQAPAWPRPWGSPEERHRFNTWLTERLDVPMAVLSVVFLGLVAADVAMAKQAPAREAVDWALFGVWSLFAGEFCLKLLVAPNRWVFCRQQWIELLAVAVPALRGLRALQALGRGLMLFRLVLTARRGARGLHHFAQRSHLGYVAGVTVLVVLCAATAIFAIEREAPGTRFQNFGDALWWAAATATTVACDLNPVTVAGRSLAVLLMIYGMFVFGYMISVAVTVLNAAPPAGEPAGHESMGEGRISVVSPDVPAPPEAIR